MADQVVRLYRPSNGTEGFGFMESWCSRCARDKEWSEGKPYDDCSPEEVCSIIGDTMAFGIDHPNYPQAWQYNNLDEPVCTAFVPAGAELASPRCPLTKDMFEEPT